MADSDDKVDDPQGSARPGSPIPPMAALLVGVAACALLSLFNLLNGGSGISPAIWQAALFVSIAILAIAWTAQRARRRG